MQSDTDLVPDKALALLNGQDWTEGDDGMASLLLAAASCTSAGRAEDVLLRLDSTLLALALGLDALMSLLLSVTGFVDVHALYVCCAVADGHIVLSVLGARMLIVIVIVIVLVVVRTLIVVFVTRV